MPPFFVQIAMVKAHAMKMMKACTKCMMFFVRPRPPDGRGIWNFMFAARVSQP